jgi:outer membrane protein
VEREREAVRSPAAALVLACAAASCRTEDSDRWAYERVVYEEDPKLASRKDAADRFERLAARPELTLREAYEMALHRSEALALAGEELVRLRTQVEQVRGLLLPYVAFRGSYTLQDRPSSSASDSVRQSFTLRDRTQYEFAARQPIFGGLEEIYTLRQKGALESAKESELRHARLLLFGDVAAAFYAVLLAERDLATIGDSLRLAQERLEELVQRNRVGISRRSEVLAQEAEAAQIQAALERLRGAGAVAWEAFRFLTGLDARPRLADSSEDPGEPGPLDGYVTRALAERHDVRALSEQVRAAEEGIGIARAGYLPTASLDATYYTHREGVTEGVDWDLMLSFEIPLFEGAVTQARLREARSSVRSAGLELRRLRREIGLEVSRAYADLRALRSELSSLEKAVASAQENYDLVQAEYRRGIVTNIEVLSSFNTLQRARLERDRARFQAKLTAVRLSTVSGVLPGGAP